MYILALDSLRLDESLDSFPCCPHLSSFYVPPVAQGHWRSGMDFHHTELAAVMEILFLSIALESPFLSPVLFQYRTKLPTAGW